MLTRKLLHLMLLFLSFNLSAMESAAEHKKINLEPAETLADQQLVRPMVAELQIVLSDDDVANITSFGDVVCQGFSGPLRETPVLSLSGNNLTALPQGFEGLTALKKLSLSYNRLRELFPPQCSPPNLEELNISHTLVGRGKNIVWSGLYRLRKLVARHAQLKELDDTVCNLSSLTSVDFSHNSFETISPMLTMRSTLVYLNFCHNRITTLSAMISNLYLLQELHLDSNKFKTLPAEIGQLPQLRVLSLNDNQLQAVPNGIELLTNLRKLCLARNLLHEFPQQICKLTQLEELYLDSNKLTSLCSGLDEPQLHALTTLAIFSISHNQLQRLPHRIVILEPLRKLNLSHNQLTSVPWEIAKLTRLEELIIDNNRIESIPDFLVELPCLVKLSMRYNLTPDLEAKAQQLRKTIKLVLTQ